MQFHVIALDCDHVTTSLDTGFLCLFLFVLLQIIATDIEGRRLLVTVIATIVVIGAGTIVVTARTATAIGTGTTISASVVAAIAVAACAITRTLTAITSAVAAIAFTV